MPTGSEKEFGVALIYGLNDTVSTLVVQSDDIEDKYALDVEVKDEEGRVITDRLDDERLEITIEGVMKDYGVLNLIGGTISYDSVSYIVKSITDRGTNNDYRKVTIKGVKYQEIA